MDWVYQCEKTVDQAHSKSGISAGQVGCEIAMMAAEWLKL